MNSNYSQNNQNEREQHRKRHFQDYTYDKKVRRNKTTTIFGRHRLVHIDLKGAPPRVIYFEKLFPLLKEWGATGILLEWENTFPYVTTLLPIGSSGPHNTLSGYTADEAHQILQLAVNSGLSIIPLIQIFGHMEFVLKHSEWKLLREVPTFPSSICPSNPETQSLVKSMIRQIVEFHSDIKYLHIGADEVWHMGLCPQCTKRVGSSKYGKASLFLDHVITITQFIKESYPSLKVIIWDDMLRTIDLEILNDYSVGKYLEPMIWHYNSKENFSLQTNMWDKYSIIFPNIWIASAFKGATGSCQHIPTIIHHISNHERWIQELNTHVSKINKFQGTAFTGWSRYDHYATMCELLPTAIPSLAICLKTWIQGYSEQTYDQVAQSLGYNDYPLYITPQPRPIPVPSNLNFPGWQIAVGIESFLNYKTKFHGLVNSEQILTWMNHWQIGKNYTNPMQLEGLIPVFTNMLIELSTLESYLRVQMEHYYFTAMLDEWIGTNIDPMKAKLMKLKKTAENQIKISSNL